MPERETGEDTRRQSLTPAALTIEAEYLRGDISHQEYITQIRQLPGYAEKPRQDERQR